MDRRIIRFSVAGLLLCSAAMGATVATKPAVSNRPAKKEAQAAQAPQSIQWLYDLKQAHRLSRVTGRPILIVFGGPWCQFCKKLDREVLSHPTIVKYINNTFVPVHLDAKKDERAAQILEVKSLPTTVILSPEADLLGSVEGYVAVKEYATVLKQSVQFQKTLRQEQVALKTDRR
ncbi:MAG: thioredoxin family protein [Planctomycetia bacterium]|nr:thioredoxin family protein [Planctomycetia bacterium]